MISQQWKYLPLYFFNIQQVRASFQSSRAVGWGAVLVRTRSWWFPVINSNNQLVIYDGLLGLLFLFTSSASPGMRLSLLFSFLLVYHNLVSLSLLNSFNLLFRLLHLHSTLPGIALIYYSAPSVTMNTHFIILYYSLRPFDLRQTTAFRFQAFPLQNHLNCTSFSSVLNKFIYKVTGSLRLMGEVQVFSSSF